MAYMSVPDEPTDGDDSKEAPIKVSLEFESKKKHTTVELYGSWKGLDIAEDDPVGELEWKTSSDGIHLYAIDASVPAGSHYYRFLVDEEDWETHDFVRKRMVLGDEYNVLEVGLEPEELTPPPTTEEETEEAEDGPQHIVYDEAAGGFIVSSKAKKKRGRGSMEFMDVPSGLVAEATAAIAADKAKTVTFGAEPVTGAVAPARKIRRRRRGRRVRPFLTKHGGDTDVDFEAEMKQREEAMGRMVYVQQLRMEQAHNEELTEMKNLWKQERTVRMQMSQKIKKKNKELKSDVASLKAEIEKLKKLAEVSSTGDKKQKENLEASLQGKSDELDKSRLAIAALRQELNFAREATLAKDQTLHSDEAKFAADKKALETQVSELGATVAELRRQNELLSTNMHTLESGSQETGKQHMAHLLQLREEASADKSHIAKAKSQIKTLLEEAAASGSLLKQLREDKAAVERDLATFKANALSLTERLTGVDANVVTLTLSLKETDEAKKMLESEMSALEAQNKAQSEKIATLEERLLAQKAEFEGELRSVREGAQADLSALSAKSGKESSERLEAQRKELEERDEEIRVAKTEAIRLNDALTETGGTLATTATRLQATAKELEEVKAVRDELQKDVVLLKANVADLDSRLKLATASAAANATTASDKIASLSGEISALKSWSSEAASASESKIAKLDEHMFELKAAIDKLGDEKTELSSQLTTTQQQLDTTKTTVSTLESKVSGLESTLKQEQADGSAKVRQLETEMATLKREMGDALSKKEALLSETEKELAETHKSLDAKVKEFLSAETTIGQLRTELEASRGDCLRQKEEFSAQMSEAHAKESRVKRAVEVVGKQMVAIRSDMKVVRTKKIAEMEKMNAFFPSFQKMMTKAFDFHQSMIDDLMEKYKRELTLRRKYFNELQDLRGNIRVFCRVRPILPFETERGYSACVDFPMEGMLKIPDDKGTVHTFEFDRIYSPDSGQAQVSEDTTEYVQSVMDGYNVSIFAYGQTGSGKTYTMNGPPENPGVNMRALKFLFKIAGQREPMFEYKIKVAMLEVYNEKINDLLRDVWHATRKKPPPTSGRKKAPAIEHKVKHFPDGTVAVTNLNWVPVTSEKDIVMLQNAADETRSSACTDMNEHSSRSHMIVIVDVDGFNHPANIQYIGKLYLVDLAGSEKIKKSKVEGRALVEALKINQSLTALGNVMESLQKGSRHIPYRDSTLTDLMANSLGGNAKTVMFINACPTSAHCVETVSSLRFAEKVSRVELGQAKATTVKKKKKKKKKAAASS